MHHLAYDAGNFSLYAGVSRIGVFKWLYCNTPDSSPQQASLIKVYPITTGNNLYKFIIKSSKSEQPLEAVKDSQKLLVAQSSDFLIKYNL